MEKNSILTAATTGNKKPEGKKERSRGRREVAPSDFFSEGRKKLGR
jgi:hypothetical protein